MTQHVHYRKPQPIRRDRDRRDPGKFCRFHNDIGHHTNKCHQLKDKIENLIKLGHLHQYAKGGRRLTQPHVVGTVVPPVAPQVPAIALVAPQHPVTQGPPSVNGQVGTISGGPHLGGTSRSSQNRYARTSNHDDKVMALAELSTKMPRMTDQVITFSEDDAQRVHFPLHESLVIESQISNKMVARILVDNESLVNILFKLAFEKIGMTTTNLSLCASTLYGFLGEALIPMGQIKLHVTLVPRQAFKYCTWWTVPQPTMPSWDDLH
ncbi:uncharacterized protein LOC133791501 [Humulus lupulus]|uniref:uncharacterized protein LOC133791501 n=1 Tax=Humulus lupulus TaxID=3486 RepID=UPI002B40A2A8|nr:uncharacterized protein LOC133791501 [Humulus lupulus]